MVLFTAFQYPYHPIHLSLMNLITIGAPSLVLALEPNKERVKGNFLVKIIANALPTGLTVFSTIFIFLFLTRNSSLTTVETSTICVVITTVLMLIYQYKLCQPFNNIRRALFATMISIFVVEMLFFRDFFSLAPLTFEMWALTFLLLVIGTLLWRLYNNLFDYICNNSKKLNKMIE